MGDLDSSIDFPFPRFLLQTFDDRSKCNIMADGFRFMPLGLVRLRTFWLTTWVS